MNTAIERVMIRHLVGSKANQIELLAVAGRRELTIGRNLSCDIVFDFMIDAMVSRRHAAIRLYRETDRIIFKLIDLGSCNGTVLNGHRICKDTEVILSPEDKIEVGPQGPVFIFDVEPRADRFQVAALTRLNDQAPTQVLAEDYILAPADAHYGSTKAKDERNSLAADEPVKREAGQVLKRSGLSAKERNIVALISGVAGFFIPVGGAF